MPLVPTVAGLSNSGRANPAAPQYRESLNAIIDERIALATGVAGEALGVLSSASHDGDAILALSKAISGKLDKPSGNETEYVDGRGFTVPFPTISQVGHTGKYSDLLGLPSLGSASSSEASDFERAGSCESLKTQVLASISDSSKIALKMASDDATAKVQSSYSLAINRQNHTGTQDASTISGLSKVATSGRYEDLEGIPNINFDAYGSAEMAQKTAIVTANQIASEKAETAKEHAIRRENHTGTQSASTITGLAPVATTGRFSDLKGIPNFGTASMKDDGAFDPSGIAQKLADAEAKERDAQIRQLRAELDKERDRAQQAETTILNTVNFLLEKVREAGKI